jgi:hypothetical protein
VDDVLHSEQCEGCHDDFRAAGDESRFPELRYLLALGTWIQPGDPDNSALVRKLRPVGDAAMPPLGREWESTAQGESAVSAIEAFIRALPRLSPGLNDGWIGGQCTPGFDSDCAFDGGRCADAGFCTKTCTRERPTCPDIDTQDTGTFCVDLGGGTGGCVAKCDLAAPRCLEGQRCVERPRLGQNGTVQGVCL